MKKLLATAATLALVLTAPACVTAQGKQPVKAETYKQLDLFADVFERVRSEYVEDVTDEQLIEAAINGMLTSLDPHSSYLSKKNFADMQVQTRGEFGGLGIEVTQENGVVKVISPMDDTPAFRAGIQPGDLITHLNDEPIVGLPLNEAVEKMRGPAGTSIKLTVRRGENATEPLQFTLERAVIRVQSVRYRLEDNVGYIRISSFNEQTQPGLTKAITEIEQKLGDKLVGYVLDLRNNPGGLLDQAVSVSDTFLERGEIVSTRGRNSDEGQRYNAKPGDGTKGKPIVVLINGGSASAAEIVAGALQDHKRGVVLGTQSFGKGSVQTILPVQGQGAMRLTTARYYTPSGKSIQALGISPDIEVQPARLEELTQSQRRREADLPHALRNTDTDAESRRQRQNGASATPEAPTPPANGAPSSAVPPSTTPSSTTPPSPGAAAPGAGAPGQPGAAAPTGTGEGVTAPAPGATTAAATGADGRPFDYQLARALDLLRGASLFAQAPRATTTN